MTCEFEICVYHVGGQCWLDQIGVDALGMCAARLPLSLDREFLDKEKIRQLRALEQRWAELNSDRRK